MRFSVIIPVYNSEKSLRRCLDSLLPQLNSDIEVLLINDGSTDSSGNICEEYASKNSCFRYFEQENLGVSSARNKGLNNAFGDYIMFVDSDDYVDSAYFETIGNYFENDDLDLLVFGNFFLNREKNDIENLPKQKEKFIDIEIAQQCALLFKREKMYSLCDKVFVKRIVYENNISFSPKLNTGEDMTFIFHYILYSKSMAVCRKVLYYVDESTHDSLSRKKRTDLIDNMMIRYRIMESELNKAPIENRERKVYEKLLSWRYYRNAYSCINEAFKHSSDKDDINTEISNICFGFRKEHVKPKGIDSFIISLPIILKLIPLINLMFRIKSRKRISN